MLLVGSFVSVFAKSLIALLLPFSSLLSEPAAFRPTADTCQNQRFGSAILSGTFAPSSDTVVADFTGDGRSDVVILNNGTATLTIQFGLGDGRFGPPRIIDGAANVLTLLAADLNGDGNQDLLTPSRVYIGAGDGTFPARRSTRFTATTARYIAGDFNGDDRMDVVSVKYLVSTLEFSAGDGTGGFGPPVEIVFPGNQVSGFEAGDFNGDRIDDIAATYSNLNGIGVSLGGITGPQTQQTYPIAGAGIANLVATGDLDNDGDVDLVASGSQFGGSSPFRSSLINNGAGVFAAQPQVPDTDGDAVKLSLNDIDSDGKLDYVKVVQSGFIVLRLGTTPGSFDTDSWIHGIGGQTKLFFQDFNGDGIKDFGLNSAAFKSFAVLPGTGERTFGQERLSVDDRVLLDASSGDFNEDSFRDVVVASDSNKLFVFFGNGATFVNPVSLNLSLTPNHIIVGDFNRDNNEDLLAIVRGTGSAATTELFYGNGNGTFQPKISGTILEYRFVGKPAVLNIDGDGFVDLVVPGFNQNRVILYQNTGAGTFAPFSTVIDIASPVNSLTASDFDGDGLSDLAILGGSVYIYLGNGTKVMDPLGVFPAANSTGLMLVTNLNGDSIPDLAVSTQNASGSGSLGKVVTMVGAGNGGFGAPTQYPVGRGAFTMAAADFDSDGNRDVAIANQNDSRLTVLYGDGTGGMTRQMMVGGGIGPRGLLAWDYDSDSRPDLMVPDYNGGVVQLLRNTCLGDAPDNPSVINVSADQQVAEGSSGNSVVNLSVSLSATSSVPVSIQYRTSPYSGLAPLAEDNLFEAGPNVDYTPVSGVLNFAAGETVKTVPIAIRGDDMDEYDEMVALVLTNASNANLGDRIAIITILDDDAPPSLVVGSASVAEGNAGNTSLSFPLTLSAPSGKPVSLRFLTGGGSATANQDYSRTEGQLSIAPGVIQSSIPVAVFGDLTVEGDEAFLLDLYDAVNATPNPTRVTGTIVNDDFGGTVHLSSATYSINESGGNIAVTVNRTGGVGGGVSVRFRTEGITAIAGQDYGETVTTILWSDNETQRIVNVPIYADLLDEPDETVGISLDQPSGVTLGPPSAATLTIVDADNLPILSIHDAAVVEGDNASTQLKFSLRLSRPSQRAVTMDFTTANDTASAGADYQAVSGVFTIPAGVTRKSLFVTVYGDFLFEPDETLFLNLSNVANAVANDTQGLGRIVNDEVGTGPRSSLISLNSNGSATGNLDSFQPSMTADGNLVAFESFANDLVPGDNNGARDVFVRRPGTRLTTMVSVNSSGTGGGNCESRSARISENGRFVAFVSCATDLGVPGNPNHAVFVRDLISNQTALVSANLNGDAVGAILVGISANGRYIAFLSGAQNMTPIPDTRTSQDVFVRDTHTGTNQLVSVNVAGTGPGNAASGGGSLGQDTKMTPDGRYVLFPTTSSDILATPATGGTNLFVRDLSGQTTVPVTINSAGSQLVGGGVESCLSDNGAIVHFSSIASTVVQNDTNGIADVFRRDFASNMTSLVSQNTTGGAANGRSIRPVCSSDGRFVSFESEATNLLATPETNGFPDVYWRDFVGGMTKLVSVSADGVTPANDFSLTSSISADGNTVVFTSFARNLVDPSIDTNNTYDIFLRDITKPTARAVSVNEGGTSTGNTATSGGVVSPDGNLVLFSSDSSNLVANDNNGAAVDVFLFILKNRVPTFSDFDGDRITDFSVFRPSNSVWYWLSSSNGSFNSSTFGLGTDVPLSGDYDGDGKTDLSVFRNGVWYFISSLSGTFSSVSFGQAGDLPLVGDYDGDNRSDLVIFRQGTWLIRESSDTNTRVVQFGVSSDIPVVGDYDGDQRVDVTVYRDGVWYILRSIDFQLMVMNFGIAGDRPVPGDFDGDGTGDFVVFRPSTGGWFVRSSSNGSVFTMQFGIITDLPVGGDYDGDGKSDIAIYRQGGWFVNRSSDQTHRVVSFGLGGDIPIPRR